ncbi:MAG: AzlC family ABC transporter permease [Clostridia bacterium]|nr:AzlC family ABC transporter permease [Clostridia bacterium]
MAKISTLTFKKGVSDGIPIALGYLSVSFAFGVTATSKMINPLISLLISMTNLTSAGQLAGVEVIASATATTFLSALFQIILTQLVINARYFLMSLTLSQKLEDKFTVADRLLCAFGITDEIFGVAVSKTQPISKKYMLGLILLPFIGWSVGTISGALLGSILPTFISDALSIALYAMFIAIVIPAGMNDKKIIPVVLISVALSCAFFFIPFLKVVPVGITYIICALVASVVGAIFFPIKDNEEE